MNTEYIAEMLDFKITSFSVSVDVNIDQVPNCSGDFKGYLCTPSDPKDPTVLTGIDAVFVGLNSGFQITCSAESIFKFEPVPADIQSAVKQFCFPALQDKIIESVQSILKIMGYPVSIQKKNR